MSNEEIERAIDFLLRSQANSEARIEQTNEQLNRLTEGLDELRVQLGAFADTQVELMRVMTGFMESEARFRESTEASQARLEDSLVRTNESLRASIGELAANTEKSIGELAANTEKSIGGLAAKQSKTEEALVRLAEAQAQSERRMSALTKVVEEERGRR
jgi:hypothetical protein